MHGGAQLAVGGKLEQLADVDDEAARQRLCFNPAMLGLDLQAALALLQHERYEAAVLVRSDSLFVLGRIAARIANELDQLLRRALVDRPKHLLVAPKRRRQRAENVDGSRPTCW